LPIGVRCIVASIYWRSAGIPIHNISVDFFKDSRKQERRGVRKVPNVHNMSLTAAIYVLFSLNFPVVFDFNVFPFPPSKPKLIGDVPINRQNVAARRIFFFLF
jgi:hypothetical protein